MKRRIFHVELKTVVEVLRGGKNTHRCREKWKCTTIRD